MTSPFPNRRARVAPWLLLCLVQCSSNASESNGSAGQSNSGGASANGGNGPAAAGKGGESNASGGPASGGAAGVAAGAGASYAGGTSGTGGGAATSASGLPVPPGDANVPKPAGAATTVAVLDWAGFKGALSFTFDDTNQSQIDYFDDMNAIGLKYTYYLISGKTAQLDSPVWPRAIAAGHELGNHTRTHQQTDTGADTDAGQMDLESKFKIKIYTMAAPMGDLSYKAIATTRYLINRGVSGLTIKPKDDSDPFNLPCYVPGAGTDQDYAKYLKDAQDGGWDVILIHGFTQKPDGSAEDDGAYQAVDYVKFKTEALQPAQAASDVWSGTVVKIGAYWRAQKLFSELTPTTSGDAKTWTWTLPPNFPPSQYLRVQVTGGTLTQNGVTLDWDGHGYYEIALDAKSLTLAP
jgi:peptidoglycan/xylan/chitin deacetylase (PgdA/CDA1 family)